MSSTMDSVNMSSTGDTTDVIDLSQSQSDKEHDPQPETPSGSKKVYTGFAGITTKVSAHGNGYGSSLELSFVHNNIAQNKVCIKLSNLK
ncbi:hypothetical protein LOK49_LG13G00836 [Camellia lanceoleosa]|uniref:Uncharacterized protein n=1 Tax=Camellia lanceoleosa TaxID=1840588 RepID=A0ACC0FLE7_9ERIC|nr:hypothetical protein LOK49_LG13G00836 [Camellia lanceoleosa]